MRFEKTILLTEKETRFVEEILTKEPKREDKCFGEDETFVRTADFGNGVEMDIKICGVQWRDDESNLPWTEAVLFYHGSQVACTEVNEEFFGLWELDFNGNTYAVSVKKEADEGKIVSLKTIYEVLDENDIRIASEGEQNGERYSEIEFGSDAGEDVIFTIWHDGTPENFVDRFVDLASDFDPDEHATELDRARNSLSGVPDIRTLIRDADEIQEFLNYVAIQLNKALTGKETIPYGMSGKSNDEKSTS